MDWATLFDRSPAGVRTESITAALADRRADPQPSNGTPEARHPRDVADPREPSPARVVADADVLAADLLVGGDARRALEVLWVHPWTTLVASDALLADATALIDRLADESLAADWRLAVDDWREPVTQPAGDHPGLASAYRGGAMHVLSFDDDLTGAAAGASLSTRLSVSVRAPAAFALLFDPVSLYETVEDGPYPGPARTSRGGDAA
jgi:hypothetical protein